MEPDSYLSAAREAVYESVIQKSRFIARVFPVQSEEKVRENLNAIKNAMPDASHHCGAYVLGLRQNVQRFDDAGEPGGTAGMPILEVLLRQGLTNVQVVVTRYFGGVLLGAGGLTRAYSGACAAVLREAGITKWERTLRAAAEADYGQYGKIRHLLKNFPCVLENTSYAEKVMFTLLVKRGDAQSLEGLFADATGGRAQVVYIDECFFAW